MRLSSLQYALRLLGYRARSLKEIEGRLRTKKYSESEIKQTADQLAAAGLINDLEFTKAYVRDRLQIYRRGRHLISLELTKKGVDRELIDQAVRAITPEEELEVAHSLLQSYARRWQHLDELARKRRAISLLQRRGFSGAVIGKILKTLK